MAKVLLIRDLTPEADAALELYKEQAGMRSNTDAAMAMMARHHALVQELKNYQNWWLQATRELREIKDAHLERMGAETRFLELLRTPDATYQSQPIRNTRSALLIDALDEEE